MRICASDNKPVFRTGNKVHYFLENITAIESQLNLKKNSN